jgi:hypothetical protein
LVSNLRRAITTAGIAFYPQLRSPVANTNVDPTTTTTTTTTKQSPHHHHHHQKLHVLSALQEISINPDALCISPSSASSSSSSSQHQHPSTTMVSSHTDPIHIQRYIYGHHHHHHHFKNDNKKESAINVSRTTNTLPDGIIDTTYHYGNKSLSSTGPERIHEFCHLLFHPTDPTHHITDTTTTTTTSNPTTTTILSSAQNYIVTGHSLWFLTFFQLLLPHSCQHTAKKKKLQNGSMIGFTLLHTTSTQTSSASSGDTQILDHYMVDPTSLVVVHGGF